MRRFLILVLAATLTLSACGTGAGDGESTDTGFPQDSAPTAGAAPTPIPSGTPTTAAETAPEPPSEPVQDTVPARITAYAFSLVVTNQAGEYIESIEFASEPRDGVAFFTRVLDITPTRISHPPSNSDGTYPVEWQVGHYMDDGWDFGGKVQIFPWDSLHWDMRVAAAQVNGITLELADGLRVGTATSSITTPMGDPWPAEDSIWYQYPTGRGYLVWSAPGSTKLDAWVNPWGP